MAMPKNIVICADGTGNSFGRHVSNVARLVTLLALDDRQTQVVAYDQGIGTDARRWKEIDAFGRTVADPDALHVLPGPHESGFRPAEWVALVRGLAFGRGLAENVGQMYLLLADLWEDGDRLFLFGFSRGAFTVRALAGLLYRCRLPQAGRDDAARLFARAWELFVPMQPREDDVRRFLAAEGQRECPVHFLGVWDTVKSYGGLRPIMLPHLRHNPVVHHVRHALALDERRGWFDATSWGRLDLDRRPGAAWSRLPEPVQAGILEQDVEEVWFRGCHSDVGGGNPDSRSGWIALRWMLGEARREGLRLNAAGTRALQERDGSPVVNDSRTTGWRLVEQLPRTTIDNSGTWPRRVAARTADAPRHPAALPRHGQLTVHESVGWTEGPGVRVVRTRRSPG